MTNRSDGAVILRYLVVRAELTRGRLIVIPKPQAMRPIVIGDKAHLRH